MYYQVKTQNRIEEVFISANLAAPRISPQKWMDILIPAIP